MTGYDGSCQYKDAHFLKYYKLKKNSRSPKVTYMIIETHMLCFWNCWVGAGVFIEHSRLKKNNFVYVTRHTQYTVHGPAQ